MFPPLFLSNRWNHEYFKYHHTDADTIDKVDPNMLLQNLQVMATVAYVLAEIPETIPRAAARIGAGDTPSNSHMHTHHQLSPSSSSSSSPTSAPPAAAAAVATSSTMPSLPRAAPIITPSTTKT
jgi:hypothetical protein